MIVRIMLFMLILGSLLLVPASGLADTELYRPLNPEEAAIPAGRYQAGVDMFHTCRMDWDSPTAEPVLGWTVTPESAASKNILVDGIGGVWYADGDPDAWYLTSIIRLNPDGSEDWSRELVSPPDSELVDSTYGSSQIPSVYRYSQVIPSVACDGAVICYVGWEDDHWLTDDQDDESGVAYLECIDLDGTTRWKTEPVEYDDLLEALAWRVSDDWIAIVSSQFTYDVYNIYSGEHVETFDTIGWSILSITGPILLDNGDWITHGDNNTYGYFSGIPYISRVKSGEIIWQTEYPTYTFAGDLSVSDEGIIYYGNWSGFRALDIDTGEELWRLWGGTNTVAGITLNGDAVVLARSDDDSILGIVDANGNNLWVTNISRSVSGRDDIVIFRDGGILYGDRNGIGLIIPSVGAGWTIDMNDLGATDEYGSGYWKLNPTPDGGLVAIGDDPYEDSYNHVIFSFDAAE